MEIDAIQTSGLDREAVLALSRRGNGRPLLQLALHLSLLFGAAFLVSLARGGALVGPAIMLEGVVLVFLFAPLHETIHRTAFSGRMLNDAVAWVAGALLLLPPDYFRQFHFAHHRFTQDPRRDPELAAPKPASFASYLWHVSGLPYWWSGLRVSLTHALAARVDEGFVGEAKRQAIVAEARLLWGCYLALAALSLAFESDAALVYWILPALAGQPVLRLYLLAEHMGCPEAPDMFENTRTTSTTAALRLLAWNMPYHAEHHAYPSVPFHALGRLHRLVEDRIKVTAPGYLALHRRLLRDLVNRTH